MPAITFKCSDAEKEELEARSNGNVSRYVKQVLFGQMAREDDLAHLVDLVEKLLQQSGGDGQSAPSGSTDPVLLGMVAELLMIMRLSAKPDAVQGAKSELTRAGLPVWQTRS